MARFMKGGLGRLSAVLIAVMAILGLNSAAFAAPGNPDLSDQKTGSITVHKYQTPNPAWSTDNDGNQIDVPADAVALDGVEFKLQRVDIDLKVDANWDKLAGLQFDGTKVTSGTEEFALVGEVKTVETANGGVALFNQLPMGVYLVQEGADNGGNNITNKTEPFFVTLPMPNAQAAPAGDASDGAHAWLYDVHVYPKNSVTEFKKEVDDSKAFKLGDVVDWTVSVNVPNLPAGQTEQTRMEISDTFDERLDYQSVKVLLDGVELEATDYTVTENGQTVNVALTEAGLAKLKGKEGKQVQAVFSTKVTDLGNGVIENQAEVFVNNPGQDNGFNTNVPSTKWGKIEIRKEDSKSFEELAGAEFTVYKSRDEAASGTNPITTFVSDDNGIASVVVKAGEKGTTYFVKETKAPTGYILSDEIHEVTVTAGSVAASTAYLAVPNTKQEVPDLPITGAAGKLLLTIGGSAVLLAAVGTAFVAIRRRSQA